MTTPSDNHNGHEPTDTALGDALNEWLAAGHALLRRVQERRQKYLQAAAELEAVETRTREAIEQLRTVRDWATS